VLRLLVGVDRTADVRPSEDVIRLLL